MKNKKRVVIRIFICLVVVILSLFFQQFHYNLSAQTVTFTESSRILKNPNRGFYHIWGFYITDESTDWENDILSKGVDDGFSLELVEINLQEYRDGLISDKGIRNLKELFEGLAKQDKHYVVRFLYDWDGRNMEVEPSNIDIIVGHIKQLKPILQKHADSIFVLQSLLVGDCGEIHDTKFADTKSLRILASELAAVSTSDTYLAVRTPVQWRKITQTYGNKELKENSPYKNRLGLYNDGMLGNVYDCGTYGDQKRKQAGKYKAWTRAEEIDFQDNLCRAVPNGGEVVLVNEYNDIDRAICDMEKMHITYINQDHDLQVMEKWHNSTVDTDDIFDGMDGISYMQARLGYRLVPRECRMQQEFWKDTLHVELDVSNSGFAPIYKACEASFVFVPQSSEGKTYSVNVEQNLSELAGGNETDRISTIQTTIPLHDLERENYDVYFQLRDQATGEMIQFANEQECEAEGYKIGQILQ